MIRPASAAPVTSLLCLPDLSVAGDPPLASSETLYSHSMVNIDRGFEMMTWDQFSKLDPECKSAEIQRLLPLVGFMTEDISSIQKDVTMVENRLQEIRCEEMIM